MATATEQTQLRTQQARALLRDEELVKSCQRALESAKAKREETRTRLRELVPEGEEQLVGGVKVKRSMKSTGRKFRLTAYLENGGKLTKPMEPFVTASTTYEAWTVKSLEGESS